MKRKYLLWSCVLFMMVLAAYGTLRLANKGSLSEGMMPEVIIEDERQAVLHDFLLRKMSNNALVFTNFLDTSQLETVATGHELLSESAGLLLRYYARTDQRDAFDYVWEQTKIRFDMKSGFSYRYSPAHDKRYTLNAAIDDLRIIRALFEAEAAFGDQMYQQEAEQFSQRFLLYNVKNGRMIDFYDEQYHIANSFITLCYADFKTLQWISGFVEEFEFVQDNLLHIIEDGFISEEFPFYYTRFDYAEESYRAESIFSIESLLTILSLAEIGEHHPASIQFIKERVSEGRLFGQYSLDGVPLNDVRSTAIYGITAMIGSVIGDEALYQLSMERMNEWQILDSEHELFGAFGDPLTGQAYSFDNLIALLAYTY